MIQSTFASAANRRATAVDQSGEQAVEMLATALRRERRRTAALTARAADLAAQNKELARRLEIAETTLRVTRLHRR